MKAICGFNFPLVTAKKSSSVIVNKASYLSAAPSFKEPEPFNKSIVNVFTGFPPFFSKMSNNRIYIGFLTEPREPKASRGEV